MKRGTSENIPTRTGTWRRYPMSFMFCIVSRTSFIPSPPGYEPYFMTSITDGKGTELLRNWYADSRVSEQRLADGKTYRYDYLFDRQHNVVETTVTLPSGERKKILFQNGVPVN